MVMSSVITNLARRPLLFDALLVVTLCWHLDPALAPFKRRQVYVKDPELEKVNLHG